MFTDIDTVERHPAVRFGLPWRRDGPGYLREAGQVGQLRCLGRLPSS